MRDVRPDADHIRLQLFEEAQVRDQVVRRLVRRADHEPGADLIADRLEVEQAGLPVLRAQVRRVQAAVVRGVSRLVAQQIPVRAGLKQPPVAFVRALAD